jgi:CRISPR-associated endonuclease Cas1
MRSEIIASFDSLSPKAGVCIADGFGIRVFVRRRHLVVEDGIGRHRRTRVFARATAGIKRLVVHGHEGFISLEAIRWLADLGIAFIQIDRDGRLVASFAPLGNDDPRLRRAQALAFDEPPSFRIAKELLRCKLLGQAALVKKLGPVSKVERSLEAAARGVSQASTLEVLRLHEAKAAAAYWSAWERVPVRFVRTDLRKLPQHWLSFGRRGSPMSSSPRLAASPANALLNYLYALLEAEARFACLAVGLDPGLGVLHADQRARDSLALDLMEAVRPAVDTYVLALLSSHTFRARDFHETRQGVCRILPPLSHALAETAPSWARVIAPFAEMIAKLLGGGSASRIGRLPTPLTQDNRSAGREGTRRKERKRTQPNPSIPSPACRYCGIMLKDRKRRFCDACLPDYDLERQEGFATAGPAALARMRSSGRDPTKTPEARAKRAQAQSQRNKEAADWERVHPGESSDSEAFRREILPLLQGLPLSRLVEATGLSVRHCSRVRRGLAVPHPRHWEALSQLASGPMKLTLNSSEDQ